MLFALRPFSPTSALGMDGINYATVEGKTEDSRYSIYIDGVGFPLPGSTAEDSSAEIVLAAPCDGMESLKGCRFSIGTNGLLNTDDARCIVTFAREESGTPGIDIWFDRVGRMRIVGNGWCEE